MCSWRCTYKIVFLKMFHNLKDVIKVIILKEPPLIKTPKTYKFKVITKIGYYRVKLAVTLPL